MMRILLFVLLSIGSFALFGQVSGEYRSFATGNWNAAGSWESFNGSTWVAAASAPTGNEPLITIRNGHTITMPNAPATLQFSITTQLDIASGGALFLQLTVVPTTVVKLTLTGTINNFGSITMTLANNQTALVVNSGGTIVNQGTIVGSTSGTNGKLRFNAGSLYIHAFTTTPGTIPLAVWNAASTCRIAGYTTNNLPPLGTLYDNSVPANPVAYSSTGAGRTPQTFGIFEWNCPAQSAPIDLGGAITTVAALNLVSNGFAGVTMNGSNNPYTLNITNSLVCNEYFVLNAGSGTTTLNTQDVTVSDPTMTGSAYLVLNTFGGTTVINASRDILVTDFAFIDYSFGGTGPTTVNVKRNYTVQNSSFIFSGGGTGSYLLNFNGTTLQTVTESNSLDGIDIAIAANAIVSIPDGGGTNFLGTDKTFTVGNNAQLKVGSSDVAGAIQLGNTAGNIRVSGTRTYASTPNLSTIEYNGSAAQAIGDGHPTSIGVNTVINNPSGVNITANATIGGNLMLAAGSGNLSVGAGVSLTTEGTITVNSNAIAVTSTSDLIVNGSNGTNLTGTYPFVSGAKTLRNFTLNRPGGGLTFANDVTITGTVVLTAGSLSFPSNILTLNGTFSATGSGDLSPGTSGTLSIGGTGGGAFGSLRFNPASNTVGTFTIARSGAGGTVSAANLVIVSSALNLNNGTFTNSADALQMANGSTLTRNSNGALTLNSPSVGNAGDHYNVTYTGATLSTGLELSNTTDDMLGTLTINGGTVTLSQNIIVNGNVSLASSTFDAAGKNIQLASTLGTWTKLSGSFTGGAGILSVDNTAHNAHYTVVSATTPSFSNISVLSGGSNSFTFPSVTTNISGNIVNNGTISHGSGTLNFNGTTTISGSGATSLNRITITGTLAAPSATTLNIAGNFTNNGTFNNNNGTVNFNGTTAIAGSSTSNFNSVTITGSVTAPSSTTLGIAGNLVQNGTFADNGGTVALNGTVLAQTISGSAITFNNLIVSNPISPGVNINNTTRLNGLFTLASGGFFDADGSGSGIFIVSSSSQTAGGMIGNLTTPANFTGNVTVERYIHSVTGGDYRYLASPVTNANVSMLKSSIFVTGSFSDRSTHADNANIDDSGNTNPSVFTYNSTTQAYVGVSGATTAGTPLNNTVGYSAYDYNNGPVTASYRGPIGKGSIGVTISSTNGNFNLVPNPYPAPIDWDNVAKTNVNNAMYVRIGNNVFSSYVGGIATNAPFMGWSGEVATGQSFFTTSNGGGTSLTFKEGDKTTNAFYFLRTQSPENYFRVQLVSAKGEQDEAVIHFAKGATDGTDSEFDAAKMKNGSLGSPLLGKKNYPNISSYLDSPSSDFAINTMNELTGTKIVKLNITDAAAGAYSIHFTDFATMYLGYNVVLVDTFQKTEMEAKENASYDFAITADKGSFGPDRFYLRINGAGVITALPDQPGKYLKVYPNPVTEKLVINLSPEEDKDLKAIGLVDVTGRTMTSSEWNKQLLEPGTKTIDVSGYASGIYVLSIQVGENIKAIRVIKK
jgi:hypothetical protein